jgi:hypothetical protein
MNAIMPDEIRRKLMDAERLVNQRAGEIEGLDELVTGFMSSYYDQFLHQQLTQEERESREINPALDLVIFKQLHDALRRSVVRRVQTVSENLSDEAIVAYLEEPSGEPA